MFFLGVLANESALLSGEVSLLCSTDGRCTRGILVLYLCRALEERTLYRTTAQVDAPSQETGAAVLAQSSDAQAQHLALLC